MVPFRIQNPQSGLGDVRFLLKHIGNRTIAGFVKFFDESILEKIMDTMKAEAGDLLIFVADQENIVNHVLSSIRNHLGNELGLIKPDEYSFLWVTDFPLFEYGVEKKRLISTHHPFTMPAVDDIPFLDTDPLKVRSRSYDLVLNGNEVVSGSIRIHDRELQKRVLEILGIEEEEATEKFGFLLDAFKYGAPPHGGIALGLDRFVMILAGRNTIRDVIAFPKTGNAVSLMDDTPSEVGGEQLLELGLKIIKLK